MYNCKECSKIGLFFRSLAYLNSECRNDAIVIKYLIFCINTNTNSRVASVVLVICD